MNNDDSPIFRPVNMVYALMRMMNKFDMYFDTEGWLNEKQSYDRACEYVDNFNKRFDPWKGAPSTLSQK